MIQPEELKTDLPFGPWSCRGCDVWDMLRAAASGDAIELRKLLQRDPNLYRAEYWYTQPIHLAVREGHIEAVQILLDAGADPAAVGLQDDLLVTARDRGHELVAQLLEEARARRRSAVPAAADHAIHRAAAAGDVVEICSLLDSDPRLVAGLDRTGGTPLHRAVAASRRDVVRVLLDRGADLHAVHGDGPGLETGYAAVGFQAIDLALWNSPFWGIRGDIETAQLLVERGAACDVVIASALGDRARVTDILNENPRQISTARPSGKRALSSAVEFGHDDIARLLLDRGADPNWPEGAMAPRGAALHAAARKGNRPIVQLLLEHGADPNSGIDSCGSATYAASSSELRALLFERGGSLDAFDLVWMGEEDEVVRRVSADPAAANTGCGGVFTAACKLGKAGLVGRLLEAGRGSRRCSRPAGRT